MLKVKYLVTIKFHKVIFSRIKLRILKDKKRKIFMFEKKKKSHLKVFSLYFQIKKEVKWYYKTKEKLFFKLFSESRQLVIYKALLYYLMIVLRIFSKRVNYTIYGMFKLN